jgi:hypothetical protein
MLMPNKSSNVGGALVRGLFFSRTSVMQYKSGKLLFYGLTNGFRNTKTPELHKPARESTFAL